MKIGLDRCCLTGPVKLRRSAPLGYQRIDCITEGSALIQDADLGTAVRKHATSLSGTADRLVSTRLRTALPLPTPEMSGEPAVTFVDL